MEDQLGSVRFPDEQSSDVTVSSNTHAQMLSQLAWVLWDAERRSEPAPSLGRLAPDLSSEDAHAIRRELDVLRMDAGAVPVGRRVRRFAERDAARSGERFFWNYLFTHRSPHSLTNLDVQRFAQPVIAANLAIVLRLESGDLQQVESIEALVAGFVPVLEIGERPANPRTSDDPLDAIARGDGNTFLILGEYVPARDLEWPPNAQLRLVAGRERGRLVQWRSGDDALRHALLWLSGAAISAGEPLIDGELIVPGGGTPETTLVADQEYLAEYAGLGTELRLLRMRTRPS